MARSRKKITLPKSKPWLLLPGEDMSQWESFEHYLLMDPPRSIRRVADERQKSSAPTLYSWSRIYRWKERMRAYDLHIAQRRRMPLRLTACGSAGTSYAQPKRHGFLPSGGDQPITGEIYSAGVWKRLLTELEILDLFAFARSTVNRKWGIT